MFQGRGAHQKDQDRTAASGIHLSLLPTPIPLPLSPSDGRGGPHHRRKGTFSALCDQLPLGLGHCVFEEIPAKDLCSLARQVQVERDIVCTNGVLFIAPWWPTHLCYYYFLNSCSLSDARKLILHLHIDQAGVALSSEEVDKLVACTEGYSGSDMTNCIADALLEPVRELEHATHWRPVGRDQYCPCESTHKEALCWTLSDIPPQQVWFWCNVQNFFISPPPPHCPSI